MHGVTSNPTIFDKAIAAGTDYDDALRSLLAADPDSDALTLFEKLEIEDLQMAADILRPVYDHTKGADGFVSIEVSPRLAYDTAGKHRGSPAFVEGRKPAQPDGEDPLYRAGDSGG